eukprot:CAMPEP_0185349756 /NCGR_PEP_ID=MMETSP1364-20130426/2491_1 /TAXON_ID=38817 /ORGANISM="Gephyrocapsa oceanica, Strain RCC1303" /LENGTH=169 /DNA_ID=CAMNT_0027949255 /DNA_START=265 /DNA_END=775 /DNA_ORIENTATION=-
MIASNAAEKRQMSSTIRSSRTASGWAMSAPSDPELLGGAGEEFVRVAVREPMGVRQVLPHRRLEVREQVRVERAELGGVADELAAVVLRDRLVRVALDAQLALWADAVLLEQVRLRLRLPPLLERIVEEDEAVGVPAVSLKEHSARQREQICTSGFFGGAESTAADAPL